MDDALKAALASEIAGEEFQPPHVHPELLHCCENDLRNIVKRQTEKNGLAIVVGSTKQGQIGVEKDMQNMTNAFQAIGLTVWKLENRSGALITGVLQAIGKYEFPPSYKFFIFYFSGHGGSQDSRGFIYTETYPDGDKETDKLFIQEGIILPLLPKIKPRLANSIHRMFLFDFFLVDDTIKFTPNLIRDILIPPCGNILTAYSNSTNASSRADRSEGGVWTRYLSQNIVKVDRPFTSVLDLTKEDTDKHFSQGKTDPQGPRCTYSPSAGVIWLHHPDRA